MTEPPETQAMTYIFIPKLFPHEEGRERYVVLDGAFTLSELRKIADWFEQEIKRMGPP